MSRLVRYVIVGAVATATHYAFLVGAVEFGRWVPWLAAGAGAVLGAQVAYLGNRAYTFAHRGAVTSSWWRFQAAAALGALANMAIVALASRWGLHYLVGQVTATVLVMLATFVVNARWTFAATRDRA